jgi:hypothetical protein
MNAGTMLRLVLAALILQGRAGCNGPGDPTYSLTFTNGSSIDLLVRSVYLANIERSMADPVRPAKAGETIWVEPPRPGYSPDGIEILTPDCEVVAVMGPTDEGAIGVDVNLRPTYEPSIPSNRPIIDPGEVNSCPNR